VIGFTKSPRLLQRLVRGWAGTADEPAPPGDPPTREQHPVTSSAAGVEAEQAFGILLRRASLVTGVAAVVCVVVAAVWQGLGSGVSALIGGVIVIAFFGARLVVMRRVARSNPQLVMMTALVVYTVKVILLGLALVLLSRVDGISGPALGLTVIVCAVVWLAAELRSFVKMRIPVFMTNEPTK